MKKYLINSVAIAAFITFFCWGFPALNGAEVNWLSAVIGFLGVTAVSFFMSWMGTHAISNLAKGAEDEKKQ